MIPSSERLARQIKELQTQLTAVQAEERRRNIADASAQADGYMDYEGRAERQGAVVVENFGGHDWGF